MSTESRRLSELQSLLNREIPLTRHLGLRVESYDGRCLTLGAPLAGNRNHTDTAFAGSLNALTTLAGWALVWIILAELNVAGQILIQGSTVSYRRPVTADFSACCCKPAPARLATFAATLAKRGKARLELEATIADRGQEAVHFRGRYAALRSPSPTRV